ncbi:MAG: MMPL family transporter [Spirochaetes bacterium]|nr:MMPL family transporter [Spirochaetota bacterium]
MDRYLRFVLKYPVPVLAAIITITIGLGFGIPRLKFDNSIEVMMPKEDREYIYYKKIIETYGNIGKFIVANTTADSVWTPRFFAALDNMITDLEEYKSFDATREQARLKKLDALLAGKEVTRKQILGRFSDDPPFQRTLARAMDRLFGNADTLGQWGMRSLRRDMARSYRLKKKELIDVILSPLTAKDISGKDDTLSAVDLVEKDDDDRRILPKSDKDFAAFEKKLRHNPSFKAALYAEDPATGKITGFGLHLRLKDTKDMGEISDEIWRLLKSYDGQLSVTPHGIPIVTKFMNDYMMHDLKTFLPLVLLVVIIVFFLNFRTPRGVLLPFATLVIADIWIMGLMGFLNIKLNMISTSLPTLMVAVGSSYSIHILNQYYIDLTTIMKIEKREGLRRSIAHISVTVLLAGITTFFGFLSLATNQVTGIREWGITSAIGVLFAVVIATSLIPAMLALLPQSALSGRFILTRTGGKDSRRETWIDRAVRLFSKLAVNHSRAVVAVFAAIAVISLIGVSMIKVETSVLTYFKKDDYIRSSIPEIRKYGGAMGMNILVDSGQRDGIKDPAFLRELDRISEWLRLEKNRDLYVSRADSITNIVKTMNRAMHNDDPAYYRIPDSATTIREYFEIFSGNDSDFDGRIDEFESLLDEDYRTAMIFAKMTSPMDNFLYTSDLQVILDKVESHLRKTVPKPYSTRITGDPRIIIALSSYVVKGQLLSLLFSLMVVLIIVILLFKNWKAGLVSVIPIGFAVTVSFGIMGWFGIRLDSATAIIAGITIGIGIDDTIHFLNTFRHFRERRLSVDETIRKTLSISGKAIIYTSLALVMGFSILVLSNFKPIILFGMLVSITMTATTLGALLILPSVIKATGVSLEKSKSKSKFWKYFYIGRFFNFD